MNIALSRDNRAGKSWKARPQNYLCWTTLITSVQVCIGPAGKGRGQVSARCQVVFNRSLFYEIYHGGLLLLEPRLLLLLIALVPPILHRHWFYNWYAWAGDLRCAFVFLFSFFFFCYLSWFLLLVIYWSLHSSFHWDSLLSLFLYYYYCSTYYISAIFYFIFYF